MEAPSSLPDPAQPPQTLPQPESQPQLQPQQQPQYTDPLNPQPNGQSQQYTQQPNHIQDYYYQNPAQAYDPSYYAYYQQYPYQNQWQYPQQQQPYAYYQPDYSAAYSQPVSHPQEPVPAVSAPYGGAQIADASATGAPQQPQQSAYPPVQISGNPAVPPGMNPAAAAAISALQQLTQFAGTMDAAERALAGYPAYNASPGPVAMHPQDTRFPPRGRGRRGGGIPSSRGGRGRGGRGRGRSRHFEEKGMTSSSSYPQPTEHLANAAQPAPIPVNPAPNQRQVQIAWCELCRVDCSSFEILEQHKNGKRHKKNLLRFEEPKNNTKPEPPIQTNPEAAIQPQVSQDVEEQKDVENSQAKSTSNEPTAEDNATKLPEATVENPGQPVISKLDNRRQGLKRKIKGGRGGKRLRTSRPIEPPKPKVIIPLLCELCNVKCDTQEVLGRHLSGKKHIAKLKKFEGHQAMYGPQGLQVLYPPNPIAQQTQFISQGHQQQQPFAGYVGPLPAHASPLPSHVGPLPAHVGPLPSQGSGSVPSQPQQLTTSQPQQPTTSRAQKSATASWTPQVYQSVAPEAALTMEANPTAAI